MSELYNPVWVILDGKNNPFRSYMACDDVDVINELGGLSEAPRIHFRETPERPIPQRLMDGEAMIKDVWITLVPGPAFNG